MVRRASDAGLQRTLPAARHGADRGHVGAPRHDRCGRRVRAPGARSSACDDRDGRVRDRHGLEPGRGAAAVRARIRARDRQCGDARPIARRGRLPCAPRIAHEPRCRAVPRHRHRRVDLGRAGVHRRCRDRRRRARAGAGAEPAVRHRRRLPVPLHVARVVPRAVRCRRVGLARAGDPQRVRRVRSRVRRRVRGAHPARRQRRAVAAPRRGPARAAGRSEATPATAPARAGGVGLADDRGRASRECLDRRPIDDAGLLRRRPAVPARSTRTGARRDPRDDATLGGRVCRRDRGDGARVGAAARPPTEPGILRSRSSAGCRARTAGGCCTTG